ncbi:peroxisomal coenzyme A diphosphatase NUDT7 isoform X2 [Varanus komodoensis]|uniref:peroxisomal coenzyme A diphosphatase NUDT7 isoform X2 n=1 Tax=Varanus komodoensis TaxID=61221 RepID=UPI001CF7716A|nr:peroxisomal coenzyme A diphosphatase NUDT7 isoform X2 [Varanus komodoensis]
MIWSLECWVLAGGADKGMIDLSLLEFAWLENGSRMSVKNKAKLQLRKFDVGARFSHLPIAKASVLIPLMVKNGKLSVLFTVRSMKLRRSPGEVCFPGGRSDSTDRDEIATALREAQEEVGLHPEQAEVICRLVPGIDKTYSLVTPVVAFIEDTFQPHPNPEEVSDVFLAPLEYFISPSKYTALPFVKMGEVPFLMHSFEYDDPELKKSFTIWGLTAHFVVFLALVIFGKKPTFEVQYDLDNLNSSAESNFMELYHEGKRKESKL